MAKIHELKIVPEYFEDVRDGLKPFEVRVNDRAYCVGDVLIIDEYIPIAGYTGRETIKRITYVLNDERYCKPGFVILGLAR